MRLLLCCGPSLRMSEYSDGDKRFVNFGKPLNADIFSQAIPEPIDDILNHLISSCQLKPLLFIKEYDGNEYKEYYNKLRYGEKFLPEEVNAYLLCKLIMTYIEKIPGGIFTVQGEEHLAKIVDNASKDDQYSIYYKVLMEMAPIARQLLRKLIHLWFLLIENSFVNGCNIPDLSTAVSKQMLRSSKLRKDPEKCQNIIQQLLMNRRIGRSVLYAHSRPEISASLDSSNESRTENDFVGSEYNELSISRMFMTTNNNRDTIRNRRDKRLSMLLNNMTRHNRTPSELHSITNHSSQADPYGDKEFFMRRTLASVSNKVESAMKHS